MPAPYPFAAGVGSTCDGRWRNQYFILRPTPIWTLVGFTKADKASRRRIGWDGWFCDGPLPSRPSLKSAIQFWLELAEC